MIRIIVADDHPIVREGLKRLVAHYPDMEVVAEAASGDEALVQVREVRASVILLDVSMPGPGILALIRLLRQEAPRLRILVLSVHSEDQYAVRTLRAGAAGYLMKDNTPDRLAEAIRRVHQGGRFVSSTLAEKLALDLVKDADPLQRLSNREFEVLSGLAAGLETKEIAARLSISPKTVSTYRARILEKLDCQTTADLIRFGIEHGLGELGRRGQ